MTHFVVIRGPLGDDDLRQIIEVVQRAEARQPDAMFRVAIDEPDAEAEGLMERMVKVNRLRPGYLRSVEIFPADE